ncbi:RNA polymerase sigma factor [Planctomycetaceae bacterium SH139]
MAINEDTSDTSISLIEQARCNAADAWQKMYEIYAPLVLSWARRGGLKEEDAADLVQSVFQLVSTNLPRFKKATPSDSFRGWLWTITRNEVRGWYRKRARHHGIASGGTDAQNQMLAVPDWALNEEAIEEIEPDPQTESQVIRSAADLIKQDFQGNTWTAFWRSAVEGHATEDIAADLNMKPGAIRQAKLRVLKRFREVLDA